MSLELKDVRAKLDPEAHRKLSAIAVATEREMGDLIREAVDLFIAKEIRKAHAGKLLLKILKDEGFNGES
jgi:predicted transcriptional regulator